MMAAVGMSRGGTHASRERIQSIFRGEVQDKPAALDREYAAPDIGENGGDYDMRLTALLAILFGLVLSLPSSAQAEIVARINLSSQRMAVFVNGAARYNWPVSTARPGYRTPTGTFKPTALVRYHRSSIYEGSPMPYSIFFLRGYAIHGSYEVKHLGRPASHGCIRLHPSNAAALYSLVQRYGTGNTLIKIAY